MGIDTVATAFLCTWKTHFTSKLRSAVRCLLEENPILTGCIEKGTHAVTGQTGLCVQPHRYTLESIFSTLNGEFDEVDTNTLLNSIPTTNGEERHHHDHNHDSNYDRDLKKMMQAVSLFCEPLVPKLGNGWDQKREKTRLFAVTVIMLPKKDASHGQDHALVHIAMSHAIGDGYTYYKLVDQLNQLMKEGYVRTPLKWNEPVNIQDCAYESTCLTGKLFMQILTWCYCISITYNVIKPRIDVSACCLWYGSCI